MAWLAVHPDLTQKVRVPEDDETAPLFEVGFWPPREAERFRIKWRAVSMQKPAADLDPIMDQDECLRQSGLEYEVIREMVRYGVRGWESEGAIPAKLDTEKIDGREHAVLSAESLDLLYRSGLLYSVGLKVLLFNFLTEEQKKTFGLRWASNTPSLDTSAADAATGSPSKTTDSSHGA